MNRLIKEKVKRLLVGLLVLTIALSPITPTLTHASILKQQDDSTSIFQRLSDDEMKEIVGGGGVKRWVERLWYKWFPKPEPYTVEVHVHTNVPNSSPIGGLGFEIKGYEKVGEYWLTQTVNHHLEGEYWLGKMTLRGNTVGSKDVKVKVVLYGPNPNKPGIHIEGLDHEVKGITIGKNQTGRLDFELDMYANNPPLD